MPDPCRPHAAMKAEELEKIFRSIRDLGVWWESAKDSTECRLTQDAAHELGSIVAQMSASLSLCETPKPPAVPVAAVYRRRPAEVHVAEWDGEPATLGAIRSWCADADQSVASSSLTGRLFLQTTRGHSDVAVGDFVLRGERGEVWSVERESFSRYYEPAVPAKVAKLRPGSLVRDRSSGQPGIVIRWPADRRDMAPAFDGTDEWVVLWFSLHHRDPPTTSLESSVSLLPLGIFPASERA